jgi:hypothetical protein
MDYTGRDVTNVIKEVIKIIPQGENELIKELKIYDDSLWNKAPELLQDGYCWQPFINILNKFIPLIEKDWHKEIQIILNNNYNKILK